MVPPSLLKRCVAHWSPSSTAEKELVRLQSEQAGIRAQVLADVAASLHRMAENPNVVKAKLRIEGVKMAAFAVERMAWQERKRES